MRVRLVGQGGLLPWAVIVENGAQRVSKRDFRTREAAEQARTKLTRSMTDG